jgi:hypothetical protein
VIAELAEAIKLVQRFLELQSAQHPRDGDHHLVVIRCPDAEVPRTDDGECGQPSGIVRANQPPAGARTGHVGISQCLERTSPEPDDLGIARRIAREPPGIDERLDSIRHAAARRGRGSADSEPINQILGPASA